MWKKFEDRAFPIGQILLMTAFVGLILGPMTRVIPMNIAEVIVLGGMLSSIGLLMVCMLHDAFWPQS